MAFELLPSKENIISTLNEDLIERNRNLYYFLELLNSISCSESIALNGNWGSGKTFFVKQAELVINTINPYIQSSSEEEQLCIKNFLSKMKADCEFSDYQPQIAVYYDAWANDNDTDPVLSIIYTIIKNVDTKCSINLAPDFPKIVSSIVECATGRDIQKIFDNLKGNDPFSAIKEKQELDNLIRAFFKDILCERGNRIIIFVDELDRCCPRYAVKLLERIKHYFEMENVTFVFSVNLNELRHTVQQFYGNGFNADRYLERFFDFRISLPPANTKGFYRKVGLENGTWVYEKNCKRVIELLHLELRELSRFYGMAKIAAYKPTHGNSQPFSFSDGKASKYNMLYMIPLMIGLQLTNLTQYNDFVNGKDSSPLKQLILSDEYCQETLRPFLSNNETFGDANDRQQHVDMEDIIQKWYEAVFLQAYDHNIDSSYIGEFRFEKEHKQDLLSIVSLLSPNALFDDL